MALKLRNRERIKMAIKPTRKEAKKEFLNHKSESHKIGAPNSLKVGSGSLKSPSSKAEKKEYKAYKKEYIKER